MRILQLVGGRRKCYFVTSNLLWAKTAALAFDARKVCHTSTRRGSTARLAQWKVQLDAIAESETQFGSLTPSQIE